jgi:hypothetical protein
MLTKHSGTPAHLMRQARILERGIPQLRTALQEGEITLYRAGEIAKLPTAQQEVALTQWVNRFLLRTSGQAIAATVIREELKTPGGAEQGADGARTPDLDRIAVAIKRAIIQNVSVQK